MSSSLFVNSMNLSHGNARYINKLFKSNSKINITCLHKGKPCNQFKSEKKKKKHVCLIIWIELSCVNCECFIFKLFYHFQDHLPLSLLCSHSKFLMVSPSSSLLLALSPSSLALALSLSLTLSSLSRSHLNLTMASCHPHPRLCHACHNLFKGPPRQRTTPLPSIVL